MNIFIIPSWYPSKLNPVNGIFTKEQALAIAKQRPDWNIWLSLWGQQDMDLPLSKCWRWPSVAVRYWQLKKKRYTSLRDNLTELHAPVLHWNEFYIRSYKKYFADLLAAHRQNLLFALQRGKVDWLHAHVVEPAGMFACQLSAEFNIPYVITEHSNPFPFPHYLQKKDKLRDELEHTFNKASQVIGVSPFQTQCLNKFQIDAVTVPNPVDHSLFKLPSQTNTDKHRFLTAAVNLTEVKGIGDLLLAIARLKQISPQFFSNCDFRIAGQDSGNYVEKAEKLGISSAITWLGGLGRQEIAQEMASCSYFVLPSHQESLGMVYIEAMFCGKPVVATYCGGAEYSVNEMTGLLVPVKNIELLSKALEEISRKNYNPEAIRTYAMDLFSEKRTTKLLEDIYLYSGK